MADAIRSAGAGMSKTRIIDLLGQKALLLPALLNAAITANERAK